MNNKAYITENSYFETHRIAKCREILKKKVILKPNNTVLEIGFGKGQETLWFASLNLNIVSVEIEMAHCVALKGNIKQRFFDQNLKEVVRADAQHLPFNEDTFDLVFCKAALHHVGNAQKTIHEMYRTAKNNGFALAVDEPTRLNPLRILTLFLERNLKFETYWTAIGTEILEETFCPFQLKDYFQQSGFCNVNSGSMWLPYYVYNKLYLRMWLLTEKLIEKTCLPYIFGQLYAVARKSQ